MADYHCVACEAKIPWGHHLCPACRELLELGRLVSEMKPAESLHHYKTPVGDWWEFQREVVYYAGSDLVGKTPLEAMRAAKKGK